MRLSTICWRRRRRADGLPGFMILGFAMAAASSALSAASSRDAALPK